MKKGDLVRVIVSPSLYYEMIGVIGIVLEYLDLNDNELSWFPSDPIVMVLINDDIAFFYADEVEIIEHEE